MLARIVDKTCPKCHRHTLNRIGRKWYMRLLPWSRYYECTECPHVIYRFLGNFAIVVKY